MRGNSRLHAHGRLLEVQIVEKANARALERASGGMLPAERVINKTLLSRAAATLRLGNKK